MEIEKLRQWIAESEKIVFFGGAGVSTESGLKDFRSPDGLYNERYENPPEEILSRTFFERNPAEFYRFYRDKLLLKGAQPNPAHWYLAALEREGRLKAVITQNIDGLHQAAGSRNVLELHGTLLRNHCADCGRPWPLTAVTETEGIPRCTCGGIIRPDIVLYEEILDQTVLQTAIREISRADMLIVGGTSLVVYPAAGLINYYRGNRLVLINRSTTPYDRSANLLIQGKIGEIFSQL